MSSHLITLYTRTPLHVGCGTSVDVVDLPIMRERITNFPVIPSTSLKGVLRQAGRDHGETSEDDVRLLFGEDRPLGEEIQAHAGCIQIMEAKLLAFPVRSLAGCFAWLTCPLALQRFQRDTGLSFPIPEVKTNQAIIADASEIKIANQSAVVLEEYALETATDPGHAGVVAALKEHVNDSLWSDKIGKRLAILHDEDFQHFISTCTEVVARVAIDSENRTVRQGGLFNQENVPCEALFYSVLKVLSPRRAGTVADAQAKLTALLAANPTLQIGGDETTGHGFCALKHIVL